MPPNTIVSAKIEDDAASAVEQRVLEWCCSHKGASVAEKREAQVGQHVLTHTPVWPAYITNGFFSWRFAIPVSCNAARRGTAEGIASRVALYDNCGIIEMNSAQNTKRTRFEHLCPRRVRTIKMAPRVGFEPTTLRLTAGCSAVELPRNLPISCVLSERAR